MRIIIRYLKPFAWQLLLCILLLFGQAMSNLLLPGLMSDIIDVGIVEMNGLPDQQSYMLGVGGKMILASLAAIITAILAGLLAARIATKLSRNMRHDIFANVERLSLAAFDEFSTASLITRTTNDTQQIQNLVNMALRILGYALIMAVGGIVLALGKSPSLSWIIALAVILLLGLVAVIFVLAVPRFRVLQKLVDKLNLISRESLSGMMVIRAFCNEQHEEGRFREANRDYRDSNRFVQRLMSVMMPAMTLIMNLAALAIVLVGGRAIAASTLPIGDMLAFIQYTMQIIMSFLMITVMFVMLPRATASAQRVAEVLAATSSITDPKTPYRPEQMNGVVEFRDVSFRYNDTAEENILENISFTARPGEVTAIIGATGSGKSTLINLIPRFYDATCGAILVDGVDVRSYGQRELRKQIGYAPQKGILFSGTVATNIRTGKQSAGDDELHTVLKQAQAEAFVAALESGPDARIDRGGANLSGGQKQRLSIARAIVKSVPIYLFDDSFSALDYQTESRLRMAIQGVFQNATVFIVAQRISSIRDAAQIIVLDEGKISGIGTHEKLLESCPLYREIVKSQLGGEELL